MQQLNLPAINPRLRKEKGQIKIWDMLRHEYVALTPEEWVRQHFTSFLANDMGYPTVLMANEVSISLNGMARRCDTVVYDNSLRARMIVEYKRPDVKITQRVFDQICRYNIVMQVDFLIVSNGIEHYCCRMDYTKNTYSFMRDIPQYEEIKG